jgi:hypothetical protein
VCRDGTPWTVKHEALLAAQRFDEAALAVTFGRYRATRVGPRRRAGRGRSRPGRLAGARAGGRPGALFGRYRGVSRMGALALQAEATGVRRGRKCSRVFPSLRADVRLTATYSEAASPRLKSQTQDFATESGLWAL